MDILMETFTGAASNIFQATRSAKESFNDFVNENEIDRIVSLTTNTTATVDNGEGWYTYTLTLVYEPRTEVTKPEDIEPVDDPTKELF